MTQGQFFKWSLTGLNSEFSFSWTSCLTKAEENSLSYYLPIAGGRIIGFIPFSRVLVLCEMLSVSSRIWTQIYCLISVNVRMWYYSFTIPSWPLVSWLPHVSTGLSVSFYAHVAFRSEEREDGCDPVDEGWNSCWREKLPSKFRKMTKKSACYRYHVVRLARISLTLSLSPRLPIIHRLWQVFRVTSRIIT